MEDAGRSDEVLPVLEREVTITQCYAELVDRLLAEGRLEDARKWASKGYEATVDSLPGLASGLRDRLRAMSEEAGDPMAAAAYRAQEFFERPGVDPYLALQRAASEAGVWDVVRDGLPRYLETGERPDETDASREWPLPSTGLRSAERSGASTRFPDIETLTRIALHEGRHDDAVTWYERTERKPWSRYNDLADTVAAAVTDTHPEVTLGIWRSKAEGWIARVKASAYEQAGRYLTRMGDLYGELGRGDEWRSLLRHLRVANARRPRMLDVLVSLQGKRRRILDG